MGSNATKGIAITLAGLVLTVGLSTTSLISATAKDNSPKNYEAMLSVELQPNTTTKDLAKAIKKDLGNLNDVDIISLSSKLDFEGKTQTFTKSNEEQVNSQKLLDSYSKSQNAFLTTIVNMKEQTDSGQTIENQEAIKPLLNKYSKNTLKNTQNKYKAKTPIVSSLMIGGSLANLNKLSSGNLIAISTKVELTNFIELQKKADEIKVKVNKVVSVDEKTKIINEELNKVLNPNSKDNAKKLTDDQIQVIDKLTRKDLNGNIFINSDEVKTKLGLSNTQISEISSAMTSFNKLPLELKDNSVNSVQAISQTTQLKTEENNQKDLGEKITQFLMGSVKADAGLFDPWNWRGSSWVNNYGWYSDSYLWINQSMAQAISEGAGYAVEATLTAYAARGCAVLVTTVIGGIACAVVAWYLVHVFVSWYQGVLQYLWNCSNGIYIKIRSQNGYLNVNGPNCW